MTKDDYRSAVSIIIDKHTDDVINHKEGAHEKMKQEVYSLLDNIKDREYAERLALDYEFIDYKAYKKIK